MKNSVASLATKSREIHVAYLTALERIHHTRDHASAAQLRPYTQAFLQNRWIIPQGYQTHISVPVLNGYDEIEIDLNENTQTYSYISPHHRSRRIVGSLAEMRLYTFNIDVWLDNLTTLFEIEPAHRARNRVVLDTHLWYLGDIRLPDSHQFAPLYIIRRLGAPLPYLPDWQSAFQDPIRPSHGIVLTVNDANFSAKLTLPNNHQLRPLDCLLTDSPHGAVCDQILLARLLLHPPARYASPDEYFDEKTGTLKLKHLESTITFTGIQKKIIKIFWNLRDGPPLTWAEVKRESSSAAKSIDQAFNKKDDWTAWIKRVGHGKFKIRI